MTVFAASSRWAAHLGMGLTRTPPRFARPGVVWGAYPEREESLKPVRRLPRFVDTNRLIRRAQKKFTSPLNATQVRTQLHRLGLCDDSAADALALVAQALNAELGLEPRVGQWRAAAELLNQGLVEMDTGEGKTLAAALAAGAAAMTGAPVHVMTANDYLAKRDADAMATSFAALGLSCQASLSHAPESERRRAYQADICYSTAKTIAFDYLRDLADQSQHTDPEPRRRRLRGLCLAIVDEADSLLIDEAQMPLVLAQSKIDPDQRARLWQSLDIARALHEGEHFEIDLNDGQLYWAEAGLDVVTRTASRYAELWINSHHRNECVLAGLRALHALKRDEHYLVRDNEIVLVDGTTGRAAIGRQLPGDLHGLVAMKEGLDPPPPSDVSSGLTYPRLFARYHHLSGLSGTLNEARRELRELYGLSVTRVERDKLSQRTTLPMRWFNTDSDRDHAVVTEACRLARQGRPVLIGVDSVIDAHRLAGRFAQVSQAVTRLDAENDADEAKIIADSGRSGRITIATQMAGRGTDIHLDSAARAAGGLHVLNLQLNRSARIDRQMVGRAARQGEPGSSAHWLSAQSKALRPESWPTMLRPIIRTLRNGRLAAQLLAFAQRAWQLEDRLARAAHLSSDRRGSRRLHFTSMGRR